MHDAYVETTRKPVFPEDGAEYVLSECGDAPGELVLFEFRRRDCAENNHMWTLTGDQAEALGRMLLAWRDGISQENDAGEEDQR